MKILFLFILIFHISHVNADEIYNLIKIPNLEIYKLKNDNNIRYLSAKGNFKIGVNKNIACDISLAVSELDYDPKVNLYKGTMQAYRQHLDELK